MKSSGTAKKRAAMSMRTILMLLVIPLIAALIVSIAFFSSRMRHIEADDEELYMGTLYTVSTTLIGADRDFYQSMLAATQFTMYSGKSDADTLAQMLSDYKENRQQALDSIEAATAIARTNPDLYTGTTSSSGSTYEELVAGFEASLADMDATYNVDNHIGSFTNFTQAFQTARTYLGELTEVTENWADYEVQKKSQELTGVIILTGLIFVAVAVILFIVAFLISNKITKSLRSVSGSIAVLAGGDFVSTVSVNTIVREFGDIASSLDEMRERLRDALIQVIGHADSVNSRAENTKSRISESQKTTNDITNAVGELAQGATVMAQDVQSTSEITVNIGSSVDRVLEAANGNLEKGQTVYENSSRVSEQLEGLKRADEETDRMAGEVAESVGRTADVVAEISKAAKSIISIASQTNMLALNASIEAARAGEAGKGFVVVANNIKDLAADSNRTAEQITSMLNTITELSERNKELTESIKEATSGETASLQEMTDAFSHMQALLKETENDNRLIVSLVESLTTDKNSILNSVESLSSVSEENAASTQQTSASLTQLDHNMESMVEQAEGLQQIASELEENVRFFRVS